MSGLFNRDTMPAIMPDLLPVTSWGSNLAKLLIWRSWKAIRAPVMARRGYRCQICGGGSGQRLECHEIWAYSLPPQGAPEEVVGVQRLMGLATLCPSCHEMFHLGFARVQGRATEAKARLMAVNRWSNSEFDAYHAAMGHRYESRCRWRWVLDLSLVQWAAPLAVDTNKGWVLGEDGSLFRTDPHTRLTAWTAILGVPFSVAGRDMPAISPAEGYDGLHPEQGDFGFVRSMGNGVANAAPEAMDEDDGEEPAAAATFRVVDAAHAAPEAVDENEDLAAAVTFRVVEVAEAEQAGRRVAELMDRPFNASADFSETPAPRARPVAVFAIPRLARQVAGLMAGRARPREGFVYVLTHPAWAKLGPAGAVKIGRTGRDPTRRLAEITGSSGLCVPGKVAWCARVADMQAVENAIKRELGPFRIRRRELFRVDVATAQRAIESAACVTAPVGIDRRQAVRWSNGGRSNGDRSQRWRQRSSPGLRYLLAGIAGFAALLAFLIAG